METDRNALLCEWLGIPTIEQLYCECGHSRKMHEEVMCGVYHCTCEAFSSKSVFPELATREGFWVLWDAPRARHADFIRIHGFSRDVLVHAQYPEGFACGGDLPEALFAAAWALREREVDGTHAD